MKLHKNTHIDASSEFIWTQCVLLFKGRLVDQQHYRRDASPTMFSHAYIIFFTNDYFKKVNIFKDNPGYEKFCFSISTSFLKLKIPTQTSFLRDRKFQKLTLIITHYLNLFGGLQKQRLGKIPDSLCFYSVNKLSSFFSRVYNWFMSFYTPGVSIIGILASKAFEPRP